jgi:hypothetical protein
VEATQPSAGDLSEARPAATPVRLKLGDVRLLRVEPPETELLEEPIYAVKGAHGVATDHDDAAR